MKKIHPRFFGYKGSVSKHHKIKKGNKKRTKPENIVVVPHNLHVHFHGLFQMMSANEIAEYLSEIWIDPSYVMVAVPKEDYEKVQQVLLKGSRY